MDENNTNAARNIAPVNLKNISHQTPLCTLKETNIVNEA
jgi:hypothetical protein